MSDVIGRSTTSEPTSDGPWWKAIVELSALFAVIATTVYVVGLFALWIPLATQITHDFSTSWYAVSLMPQITVVGQGVKALLGYPLLIASALIAFPFLMSIFVEPLVRKLVRPLNKPAVAVSSKVQVFGSLRNHFRPVFVRPHFESYTEWWDWYRGFGVGHLFFAIVGLSLPLLGGWSWFNYAAFVLTTIGSWIGADWIMRSLDGVHEAAPRIRSRRWFFRGLVCTYATLIISTFLLAGDEKPALPYATTEFEEVKEGLLVAHSDGYWYLFDEEGQLRAVPDDEAGAIQVSSGPVG